GLSSGVSQSAALSVAGADDGSGNVVKIDDAGNVSDALSEAAVDGLTQEELEGMGPAPTRPRVTAVGFAPTGEIYVLFEHAFLFRVVDDPNASDPFSPSSPYTCQLFRADLDLEEALSGDVVSHLAPSNLRCITTQHQVPTWRSGKVMQFDRDGVLYFPAHLAGTADDLIYAYDPRSEALTEKVNANICWADVEVTPAGGIFYTGITKVNESCSGTSFF